ncbi:MAG TPA: prenyltransferase [Polyangiaceae bacterium]
MLAPSPTRPTTLAKRVGAFVRLGRPRFLVGGFALYGLGAAVAAQRHAIDLHAYAWGQAAITTTQLMTHYANDYFDLAADRANRSATSWSGGSRVLPEGELAPRVALVAALVLAAGALGIDALIGLRVTGSGASVLLLVAALALSWEYSAPPLRLHSRGLGAPTAALVVTVLTPLVGYTLQARGSLVPALAAAAPLFCAQAAMIFVIDFPDAEGDGAAGKATLVVRLGGRAASRLCVVVIGAVYVVLPLMLLAGLPARVAIAISTSAPVAVILAFWLVRGDWKDASRWARLTLVSVAWFGWLVVAELVAFLSLVGG